MRQKEEELLLKDLCARLPYRVKCFVPIEDSIMELTGKRLNYLCFHKDVCGTDYSHELEIVIDPLNDANNGYIVKPYLRPLSSMTEEEKEEYEHIASGIEVENGVRIPNVNHIDWLNAHHFDYRELIEKDLAIEVTTENNPYI